MANGPSLWGGTAAAGPERSAPAFGAFYARHSSIGSAELKASAASLRYRPNPAYFAAVCRSIPSAFSMA
jgi:hypothetical protein